MPCRAHLMITKVFSNKMYLCYAGSTEIKLCILSLYKMLYSVMPNSVITHIIVK